MESSQKSLGQRLGAVAIWVVVVLEAAMMVLAGTAKFSAAQWWTEAFVAWGYPAWFSYFTGGAEALVALVMLVPRFSSYAAGILIVIMLGALGTVLLNPGRMGPVPPIANIVALTIILIARWKVRWRPS